MPYYLAYQLEDNSEIQFMTFKNKNEVIDQLLLELAMFEPTVLQLREPSGHMTLYNISGDEV